MSEQIEVDESEFDDFQVEEPTEIEPAEEPEAEAEAEAEEPVAEADDEEPAEPEKQEDPYKNVDFNEVQQKFIKDRITSPLVGKKKEVEEENKYLRGLLKAHGIEETGPKPPEVPPRPDPFDPDYEQKIEEREKIIAQRANWDIQSQMFSMNQQASIQAELNQRNEKYYSNASSAGIEKASLLAAGDKVLAAEVNPNTIDYIMRHEQGPKITMYLGENPVALQTLSAMPPMQAVATIEKKIAPFLEGKVKVEAEDPPEPTEQLKGRGASKLSAIDQEIADLGVEVE